LEDIEEMPPKIRIRDLYKSFGKQQVLKGLNLDIPAARTTVILGPSGIGKSVVLKHLIGLMKPDRGEILIDGMDITKMNERELNRMRKKFGMLFQGAALFDSMTRRGECSISSNRTYKS